MMIKEHFIERFGVPHYTTTSASRSTAAIVRISSWVPSLRCRAREIALGGTGIERHSPTGEPFRAGVTCAMFRASNSSTAP